MPATLLRNPVFRFLVVALGLYLFWYMLYELWLHPIRVLDKPMIESLISASTWVLELLNYKLLTDIPYDEDLRIIGIDGTIGVWIGDPCNGITVMALFVGYILAFPGKFLNKALFIPFGLLTIHILNIIRVACLAILLGYGQEFVEFNHTYTFQLMMYGYIFLLWYFWSVKWNNKQFLRKTTKEAD